MTQRTWTVAATALLGLAFTGVALSRPPGHRPPASPSPMQQPGGQARRHDGRPPGQQGKKDGKHKDGKGKDGQKNGLGKNARGKKLTPPQRIALEKAARNPNVSPAARGSISRALGGNFLSSADRQNLAELVAGKAGLSEDERQAVQAALDYDAVRKAREQRYLWVENATGEVVTIHLLYRSLDADGQWRWAPAPPDRPDRALRYRFQPGGKAYLKRDERNRVAAGQVRLWVESASGRAWRAYRDSDLVLTGGEDAEQETAEVRTWSLRLTAPPGGEALAARVRR